MICFEVGTVLEQAENADFAVCSYTCKGKFPYFKILFCESLMISTPLPPHTYTHSFYEADILMMRSQCHLYFELKINLEKNNNNPALLVIFISASEWLLLLLSNKRFLIFN